jgi:hypothetical protein
MDTVLLAAGSLWPTNIRLAALLPSLGSFPFLPFPSLSFLLSQ